MADSLVRLAWFRLLLGNADLDIVFPALVVAADAAAAPPGSLQVAAQPRAVGRREQRLGLAAARVVDRVRAADAVAAPAAMAVTHAAAHPAGGVGRGALDPGAVVGAALDRHGDAAFAARERVHGAAVGLAAVARHEGELVGRGAARKGESQDEDEIAHGCLLG